MKYLESIQVIDGAFQNLPLHIERMQRTIGHALPLDLIIPEAYSCGVVKCRIVYTDQAIEEVSYQPYTLPKIQSLRLIEDATVDYSRKWADRSALNALLLRRGACDDVLLAQRGYITDTSFCNVVFESKDGLFTPTSCLLEGTKRKLLLCRGVIRERVISVENLSEFNKVYLINAMLDLSDRVCVEIENIVK